MLFEKVQMDPNYSNSVPSWAGYLVQVKKANKC
jgi:hypothetical protein